MRWMTAERGRPPSVHSRTGQCSGRLVVMLMDNFCRKRYAVNPSVGYNILNGTVVALLVLIRPQRPPLRFVELEDLAARCLVAVDVARERKGLLSLVAAVAMGATAATCYVGCCESSSGCRPAGWCASRVAALQP